MEFYQALEDVVMAISQLSKGHQGEKQSKRRIAHGFYQSSGMKSGEQISRASIIDTAPIRKDALIPGVQFTNLIENKRRYSW